MTPRTWSSLKRQAIPEETVEVAWEEQPRHNPEDPVVVGEGGPTSAGWHSAEAGIWCMKEGQYKYVRGIKTNEAANSTPDHFAIGAMLHGGRAEWFGRKFSYTEADKEAVFAAASKVADEYPNPVSQTARDAAAKYLGEYMAHWSTRAKPRPVAAEHLVGPAPLQPGDLFPLWRTARLDDFGYYPEAPNFGLCIGEAKTTSGSINDCIQQYTLHGQILMQAALWKTAPQGEKLHGPIKGAVLDIIKKGYGKDKSSFARHFIEIPERALAWYVKEMRAYLREYASLEWDTDAPRNIMACTRIVGRGRVACEYRPLCLHGKNAAGNYVLKDGQSLAAWQPSADKKVAPWE